ncbi:hypothetical protein PANT_22c00270 [Moesziomyces antarcticus T-34]|uniref:Uncharacterized protein n=1 Tax=Pseudozyma antarctica (strain T-34) TaxID=1151754 RepID=M9MGA7_PSEA3|nr:hypothetical protein PANT_22c00270 [Moesziomyces antarcticus T-34]
MPRIVHDSERTGTGSRRRLRSLVTEYDLAGTDDAEQALMLEIDRLATGLVSRGSASKQPKDKDGNFNPPEHPLHYADVPALVERLKLFLAFEVRSTAGCIDVAVSANTAGRV